MTLRERQWIVNIQLNQLKCDNPFLDDYYYTVFNQKSKLTDSKDIKHALKNDKEETKVTLSAERTQEERYISYFYRMITFDKLVFNTQNRFSNILIQLSIFFA